jgi:alanine racemase
MTGVGSVLHVDLDVFSANIARVRDAVSPAELMLVVKNDAYGHGVEPVVRRAVRDGVRWFGAFDVLSADRVRRTAGEDVRIFVWIATTPAQVRRAIDDKLDIGVGDASLLRQIIAAADRSAPARVHLKIDTGLHRNGVRLEDWPAFVATAAAAEREGALIVEGIWSHIAEASDAEDDAARAVFEQATRAAVDAGLRPPRRHLAASAAAFARSEFRYDLVRVGAFCYGIRPAGGPQERALGVRPVATWQAPVIEVVDGRARIAAGSGDGLLSSLAGRADVLTPAGLRRLLAVGAYSEVVAWEGATPGDLVTLYGTGDDNEKTATSLAESIGTIGEEIAVRVSPLVPRRYRGEDSASAVVGEPGGLVVP